MRSCISELFHPTRSSSAVIQITFHKLLESSLCLRHEAPMAWWWAGMEVKGKPSKSKYVPVTSDEPESFAVLRSTAAITDSTTTMGKKLGQQLCVILLRLYTHPQQFNLLTHKCKLKELSGLKMTMVHRWSRRWNLLSSVLAEAHAIAK